MLKTNQATLPSTSSFTTYLPERVLLDDPPDLPLPFEAVAAEELALELERVDLFGFSWSSSSRLAAAASRLRIEIGVGRVLDISEWSAHQEWRSGAREEASQSSLDAPWVLIRVRRVPPQPVPPRVRANDLHQPRDRFLRVRVDLVARARCLPEDVEDALSARLTVSRLRIDLHGVVLEVVVGEEVGVGPGAKHGESFVEVGVPRLRRATLILLHLLVQQVAIPAVTSPPPRTGAPWPDPRVPAMDDFSAKVSLTLVGGKIFDHDVGWDDGVKGGVGSLLKVVLESAPLDPGAGFLHVAMLDPRVVLEAAEEVERLLRAVGGRNEGVPERDARGEADAVESGNDVRLLLRATGKAVDPLLKERREGSKAVMVEIEQA